jgi:hypothetical protein
MAALGVVPLRDPFPPLKAELLPVTDYDVVRGRYLGEITIYDPAFALPEWNPALASYIVRQIRILYRQLWPTHGQRFPQ